MSAQSDTQSSPPGKPRLDGLEAGPREEWWHEVIEDIRHPVTALGSGEIAA